MDTDNRGVSFRLRPKWLELLGNYDRKRFVTDLWAGVTVGIVALSLCIGLGIASGATPQAGLYAGIVSGFLISFLGGSRVQVGGPAGAFVGMIALLIAKHGLANTLVCTMMAGGILFLMGAFRLGDLIRFVPQPVTAGFTCGIAITILTTQLRPFFGLSLGAEPVEFLPKMLALAGAARTVTPWAVVLGVGSVLLITYWPVKWQKRIPGSFVAVIVGTAIVSYFSIPVETIAGKFGNLPSGFPLPSLPAFDWRKVNELFGDALSIALLCAIESLLSAVVSDGLIDDRHDSNQELKAQGIANLLGPLFGALPSTGVIARTATNVRSGATSPVAGMVHAAFLLVITLVAAPVAGRIPLVSLAAVLGCVAWRMGEWDEFLEWKKRPRSDVLVFLTTFLLTVCFDLSLAVKVGMVLAAFLFVKRVADTTQVHSMTGDQIAGDASGLTEIPEGVLVYRVFGALLFGAADKLDAVLRRSGADTRVVILHMAAVTAMDATALDRLVRLHEKLKRHGRHLVLCGPHTQPYFMMEKAGFLDAVGELNIAGDLQTALARAKVLIETPPTSTNG